MKRSFTITRRCDTEGELINHLVYAVNNLVGAIGEKTFKIDISVTDLSKNKRKPTRQKDSIKAVRQELMGLVREYVFLRDEHRCLICGSTIRLVLGHFIAQGSGNTALRYEVTNVAINCNSCNSKMLSKSHCTVDFISVMRDKFGVGVVLSLLRQKNHVVKWGRLDYDRKISYYKEMIKDLND